MESEAIKAMANRATMEDASARTIAVIGGGWAGLSAAVALVDAGRSVTVFEAARTLGGRARRVPWRAAGGREVALDNGQHILIGAYHRTLALLVRLGVDLDAALERTPLALVGPHHLSLKASAHRAPWHLVTMLLTARGLGVDERWAIGAFMWRARRLGWSLPEDETVAALLTRWQQPPQLIHKVWEPLCVAALNTPVSIASAQVFVNVLRDSLGGSARDSDLLLPRADLGSLLPDAVARFVDRAADGSTVRLGERIQNVHADETGVSIASGSATALGTPQRFAGAVVATPSYETARLLAPLSIRNPGFAPIVAACESLAQQPILTVYLLYRERPRWPSRMLALEAAPHVDHFGQWAFDRSDRLDAAPGHDDPAPARGLVAVVISADGAHREMDGDALIAAVAKQMADVCGLSSRPIDARVIVEKRATFECAPNLARPDVDTPHPRLVVAGDYVATPDRSTHYPGTLETAVIAGERAAARLSTSLDTLCR